VGLLQRKQLFFFFFLRKKKKNKGERIWGHFNVKKDGAGSVPLLTCVAPPPYSPRAKRLFFPKGGR
jgi:hypothetical protein